VRLLLDLLGDVPLEEDLRRDVLLGDSHAVQRVDEAGDLLLVVEDLLEDLDGRAELRGRSRDRLEHRLAAALQDVVQDLVRVRQLLGLLDPQPMGEPLEAALRAVGRHGEVEIGRLGLRLDLRVQRILHLLADHEPPPFHRSR
jgi:hypothetical protein